MLPKQRDVEAPLLEVLAEIGGQGKPKEIYPLVTRKFPQIREEDLAETVPSGGSSKCVPWGWAHSLALLFMVDELSLGLALIVVEAIYKAVSAAATSPCPRRRVEASGFSAPWGCGLSRAH